MISMITTKSDGYSCGIAAAILLKCLAIHIQQDDHCGVVRPTLRQQVDLIEDLELRDKLQQEDQARHRPNQWASDVNELLEGIRSIYRGGLVDVRGNVLKPCDKEKHVEPNGPPYRYHGDRRHCPIRVLKP